MANKRQNHINKTANTLNSRWLQNTLRSMGVAGTEMIKDLLPATSETISSGTQAVTDTIKSVRGSKTNNRRLTNAIKSNPAIKMGQDFFKNAINDIKTGNIYNTERTSSDDSFMSDFDTTFSDIDELYGPDENPDVNIVNQGTDESATIKALQTNTEYQLKSSKATVDSMVSIASTNIMNMNEIGSRVLSELTAINTNLASLVEYNNTNMTKFIDASIGYYEQMSTSRSDNYGSGSSRLSSDDIYGSNGGLNFQSYKEYVKQNIIDTKENSMFGSFATMILENKDAFITNPLGGALKAVMGAALPGITKSALASFDKSLKDFIPVMLERIGELGDDEGINPVFRTVAKVFGVKTKRKTTFDLSKIEKGPVPFNGMANHTIIEIIPKYLRESNTYLREIAEAITGRSHQEMAKNFTGFDWETGEFKNLDEMRDNIYSQIQDRVTSTFINSEFGEKMASQKSLLASDVDRENYDKALEQLYSMIEKHEGAIDFSNKDHISEIMSGVKASDSIKNLIESYIEHLQETSDAAIGNAIATKQKATREKNVAFKDVESNATERGLRQFIDRGSYDDYLNEKYSGHEATIRGSEARTQNVNMSVPSLLQGIQNTLDRGIYVQIKSRLGSGTSDERTESTPTIENVQTETQTKEHFKQHFTSEDESEDADIVVDDGGRSSIRTRVGTAAANKVNTLTNVLNSIMAGNSDRAFDAMIQGVQNKFKRAGEFLSEHFFTPIKKTLFGEKNADGYIEGGIFAGVNNRMKESFYSLRRMITGKGYTDAEGNVIQDANEEEMKNTVAGKLKGMLSSIKEGISVRLFGEKDEDGEVTKEGVLPKARKTLASGVSSFMTGLTGWKHALFGKKSDETDDPEEAGRHTWQEIKDKAKDTLPAALTGTMVGAAGGVVSGGILGTLVGGPIGGAMLGLAGGIASRSDKFKNWLFGPEDEEGNRVGGVISKKVQDYVRENKKFLAGGAAIGAIKGTISGGGILGTLVGGPIAGALLGIGTSMIVKSDMFHKFLYGDERAGYKGLINTVKGMFSRFGKSSKTGESSGGKMAGMLGIGAGVGAITVGTLANSGILGLSLGPAGPIGGAILGLGAGILAQKENFKEWLFGTTDPETGEKRLGVLGKFSNMLKVNVFQPIGNNLKAIGREFKSFLYYDVLQKFNNLIEPIGNAIFGTISNFAGTAIDSISGFGRYIKENFLDKGIDKLKGLLTPVTKAVNTVTKGVFSVGKAIIKAPIKLVEGITSPIAIAVGKTIKGATKAIFKTLDLALVKPIHNLVLKPLVGIVSFTGKVIKKPFEIIGGIAEKLSEKVENLSERVSIFFHNIAGEFKQWLLHDNPVARGLRAVGQKVKDFGARIKDTAKIIVSPITSFVKSALTEVKDHLISGTKKFFSALNPINWIKWIGGGIGKLLGIGGNKKKSDDPTKMGRLRYAWYQAGQGMIRTEKEGYQTYRKATKHNKYQGKYGRKKTYYQAEDGTTYTLSDDKEYYMVEDADGKSKGAIKVSELPEGLEKKTTGVDGKFEVRRKNRFDRQRQKNRQLIDKWTGHQKSDDTEENRKLAIEMAKKKGKTISFYDIETEDAQIKRQQLNTQEETRDATCEIRDTLDESNQTQRSILETIKFFFTSSREERAQYKAEQRDIRERAKFLSGKDKKTDEDKQRAAEIAYEHGENKARIITDDNFKEAGRRQRKKTAQKFNEARENRYGHNYKSEGFFKGFVSNAREAWNEIKGGVHGLNNIEKHEDGISGANAGLAIVGEAGPEVMYKKGSRFGQFVGIGGPEVIKMDGGETIIPNNRIQRYENGTEDAQIDYSNLDDDTLIDSPDSKKLTIGERIVRELLNIKKIIKSLARDTFSRSSGDNSYDDYYTPEYSDYDENGYDTTNIDKIKGGIKRVGSTALSLIPGSGLVRGAVRGVRNTIDAGATVVGAVGEVGHIVGDKVSNTISSVGDSIDNAKGKMVPALAQSSLLSFLKQEDEEDEEAAENAKAEAALAEVTGLTGEKRHAEVLAQKEEDSDDARQDAILQTLQNIDDGQKEHSSTWNSIFSKKGLITGGLLLLGPIAYNFFKNVIPNLVASIKDWAGDFLKDFNFGLDWLGDGKSVLQKLADTVLNLGNAVTLFAKGEWINAVKSLIFDEDGNVYNETGARAKYIIKKSANRIAKVVGLGNKRKGAKRLTDWGKKHTKKNWDKLRNKGNIDDAMTSTADDFVDDTMNGASIADDIPMMDPNDVEIVDPDIKNTGASVADGFGDDIIDTTASVADDIGTGQATLALPGADVNGNVVGKTAMSSSDDLAEGIAKNGAKVANNANAAMAGVADDAAKATSGLWDNVIGMLKKAFKGISNKIVKKTGTKIGTSFIDDIMKNIAKCKGAFGRVAGKIAAILGLNTALAATVIGFAAKEVTWVVLGSLNGATGAKRLFRTDNVDGVMVVISTVIGGLLGTTVGSIIDVINELVVSVLGIDIITELASLIYRAIMNATGNEEAAEALRRSQEEFQQKYVNEQNASLSEQYQTMRKIGAIGANVTEEQYIEGAKNGEYSAEIQSFADYNDEKHKTIFAKAWDGISGAGKWIGKNVGGALFGSTDKYYVDEQGNQYRKNDDGTYQVTDSQGNDLGFVHKDVVPENAQEVVNKKDGFFQKAGKGIVKGATWVKDKVVAGVTKVKDTASAVVGAVTDAFSFGPILELMKAGDIKGLIKFEPDTKDKDGFINSISGVTTTITKVAATPITAVIGAGKAIISGIKKVVSGIKNTISFAIEQIKISDQLLHTEGVTLSDYFSIPESDDGSPLSGFAKAIVIGSRVVTFPIVYTKAKAKELWQNIKAIAGKVKAGIIQTVGIQAQLGQYVKKGDPVGLWQSDLPEDEENPLGGIANAVLIGGKIVNTIPASVSWVGHKIWDGLKAIGSGVKKGFTHMVNMHSQMNGYIKKGDPAGLWDSEYVDEEGNPIGGFFKGVYLAGKTVGMVPASISWVGHKVWDGLKAIGSGIKKGFVHLLTMRDQMSQYVKNGDPAGLWDSEYVDEEGNPIGGFYKGVYFAGKLVNMIPASISWVGHKVWDGLKAAGSAIKNGFVNFLMMRDQMSQYVKNGDPAGLWDSEYRDEDGNPVGGFYKGVYFAGKLVNMIPASISWVGHKVWDGLKVAGSAIKTGVMQVGEVGSQLGTYIANGDPAGLWNSELVDDAGNPVGGFFNGIYFGGKILATVPAAVSWVGHKVWDGLKAVGAIVKNSFVTMGENIALHNELTLDGDVGKLWDSEMKEDPENPVGSITSAAVFGSKIIHMPFAAISWVGHKVYDGIMTIPKAISGNYDKFSKTLDKIDNYAAKGEIGKIWSTSFDCTGADPLTPIWHIMEGVVKIFQTLRGVINYIPNLLSKAWDGITGFFGDIWDGVTDFFGDTASDAFDSATNTIQQVDGTYTGGSGSGRRATVVQGGRGDTEPSTLNGMPYFSQKDPRWGSNKFIRSDGTDDGATMADTGCGPTAMSMVISDITGTKTDPVSLAKHAQESGTRDDTGTNWNFVESAASSHGISSVRATNPTSEFISQSLDYGTPMVLSGQDDGTGRTPYTTAGHYVVAAGKDHNGNIVINDPRGSSYSRTISPNALAQSTNAAWSFTNNPYIGGYGSISRPKTKKNIIKIRGGKGGVTAQDVVQVALNEVGYLEKTPNSTDADLYDKTTNPASNTQYNGKERTKYALDLGLMSNAQGWWCACFVSWCIWVAANKDKSKANELMCGKVSARCKDIQSHFNSHGQYFPRGKNGFEPRAGDLVLFNWTGDKADGVDHIGIVVGVDSDNIVTVEGNSGNPDGSTYDGVFEHTYKKTFSDIDGYCRPAYDGTSDFQGLETSSVGSMPDANTSIFSKATTLFGKYGSALFNAVLTGNYDIDWESVFAESTASSMLSSGLSGDGTATASFTGGTNESNIWNYLRNKGFSAHGTAGVMGNWMVESGLIPNNLQNTYESSLGMDDEMYTARVDAGSYSRESFIHDEAGYGLPQWTHSSRKEKLYDFVKGRNASVGDLATQLDFFMQEMNTYSELGDYLKTSKDYNEATEKFEAQYEKAGVKAMDKRKKYAKEIYDTYSKLGSAGYSNSSTSNKINTYWDYQVSEWRKKIRERTGSDAFYDQDKMSWYYYDTNSGNKIYGSLEELSKGPEIVISPFNRSNSQWVKVDPVEENISQYKMNYYKYDKDSDTYVMDGEKTVQTSIPDEKMNSDKLAEDMHALMIYNTCKTLPSYDHNRSQWFVNIPNSNVSYYANQLDGLAKSVANHYDDGNNTTIPSMDYNLMKSNFDDSGMVVFGANGTGVNQGGFGISPRKPIKKPQIKQTISQSPTINVKKYTPKPIQREGGGYGDQFNNSISLKSEPLPTMKKEQNTFNQTNNLNVDNANLERLLTEVVHILGTISRNSDNLSALSDIRAKLSHTGSNNIITNTTNNITNQTPSKQSSPPQVSGQMSRNEQIARKIAFG